MGEPSKTCGTMFHDFVLDNLKEIGIKTEYKGRISYSKLRELSENHELIEGLYYLVASGVGYYYFDGIKFISVNEIGKANNEKT